MESWGTSDNRCIPQRRFGEHLLSEQLCPISCFDFAEGTPHTLGEIGAEPVTVQETWLHCLPRVPRQGRDVAGGVGGPLPSHP